MDTPKLVLDYEPPKHRWRDFLRASAKTVRDALRWLFLTYEGRLCVLATGTLAPIAVLVLRPRAFEYGLVFAYHYERPLQIWLAAYAFAFWPAYYIVHCWPFSRPGRLPRTVSTSVRVYLLSLIAVLVLWMQGLIMFYVSNRQGHYLIVGPLMYAACAVFGWYSSLFKRAAALRLKQWGMVLTIVVIAGAVWIHRCPHVTIVTAFAIPVYQDGKSCGNFKRYLPWYLDRWR